MFFVAAGTRETAVSVSFVELRRMRSVYNVHVYNYTHSPVAPLAFWRRLVCCPSCRSGEYRKNIDCGGARALPENAAEPWPGVAATAAAALAGWLAGWLTGRMARGRVQEPPREGVDVGDDNGCDAGGRNPAPRPTFMYVWRRLWRRRRRRRISLYACGKPNVPAPRPDATAYNNNTRGKAPTAVVTNIIILCPRVITTTLSFFPFLLLTVFNVLYLCVNKTIAHP